jgi:hypothetical protein
MLRYLPSVVLSLIIFFTVDIAYAVRKFLGERFGPDVYNVVYIVVFLALAYALVRLFRSGKRPVLRILGIVLIGLVYFFLLRGLKYGIEKIHYVEYGLLAALSYHAFSRDFNPPASLFLGLLSAFWVGLLDEFIQYLNPDRVGEFRDALINLNAGFWGLVFFVTLRGLSFRDMRFVKKDATALFSAGLLCVAGSLAFAETAHGYGHLIHETDKMTFYSSFKKETLAGLNGRVVSGGRVAPKDRKIYSDEADRHRFQRDFYRTNKFYYEKDKFYMEYGKSLNENMILEKYYSGWLDPAGARWDDETRAFVQAKGAYFRDKVWSSRVKETIIISWSRVQVRVFFTALACLLLIGYAFARPRLRA